MLWTGIKVGKNKKAYDLLVNAVGELSNDILRSIKESYDKGITDEFIRPIIYSTDGKPIIKLQNGDLVVFLILELTEEDN